MEKLSTPIIILIVLFLVVMVAIWIPVIFG